MKKTKRTAAPRLTAPPGEPEHLRTVVEATPVAIVVVDERGCIVIANSQALRLFGYDAGELVGKPVELLVPERFRPHGMPSRDYFLAPTGRPMSADLDLFGLRKDGSEVPVEIGLNPLQTPRGKFVLAAIVDLTERNRMEEWRHTEEHLRLVIDDAASALIMTDGDGRMTLVNSQVERIFGYLRDELLNQSIEMLLPERFRGDRSHFRMQNADEPATEAIRAGSERWGLHKDGREVPLEIGLRPIRTQRGDYVLASIVDISERMHADEMRAAKGLHAAEVRTLNSELDSAEVSLRNAEQRARRQAARLEALWHIVNTSHLRGHDLVLAMLREAAAAVRPGQSIIGVLVHAVGSEYVIDAVSGELGPAESGARRLLRAGGRMKIADTIRARDLEAGRTESWEDIQTIPDLPARARELGWRSMITTEFVAGATVYMLTLASIEPPAVAAFSDDDHAYTEILGSVFAREFELEQLENSLRGAEERSRQHAQRLEALWKIANNPALHGGEPVLAMLRQGAASIRPGQCFRGILARIEGDEVVTVGVGLAPSDDDPRAALVRVGSRRKLAKTLTARTGRTHSWDDLRAMENPPEVVASLGWQAAISTQFDAGASRYALTFASPTATTVPFGPEDLAYVEVLAASFASQLQVHELAVSLRAEEERARQHALRLEALWKIVNDPTLRDRELWLAMLGQAAGSIRPGQGFHGMLWRIHGTDMILEAVADSTEYPPESYRSGEMGTQIGTAVPLEQTVVGKVLAEGGGTRSWDDIQASAYSSPLTRKEGLRSFVVTTFGAGGTIWALSFSSKNATLKPLGAQDTAYIEVLASFFANHVQQRWQFERIQYQQSHDVLTGLLNRSQWRSQARAASVSSTHFAVILVDVNAFHEINESYGHITGDALLVEIGEAIQKRASGDEIVGRVGGDVFGIYVANPKSNEAVLARAYDFARVFTHGFSTGDRDGKEFIARTASLGVAAAPKDGTRIDAILLHADAALIAAKGRGLGATVMYEAGMEDNIQRRAAFRNELAAAISGDQFMLYYQPHVELCSGRVTGCEALIRWNHPKRGLVLPGKFIPFAEEIGLITGIDDWVTRNAFAASKELSSLCPDLRVYFNLSGRQAGDPKLVRAFTDAARNGVPLEHIGIEITESDAMRDVEATRRVCRALRRLGVRIALDDFGTGYSSLASLKRLPIDIVKIDRAFISGVLTNPDDETITKTIISISEYFGFESLAEGAEHPAEIEWLARHSCHYVQGFAVCHPLPLEDFKAWVAAHDRELAAARS